ncbi:unnamed protein product [Boreogadus saida]
MPSSLMTERAVTTLPGEQRRRRDHSVSILCWDTRSAILSSALKAVVQPLVLMRLPWKRATLEPLPPLRAEESSPQPMGSSARKGWSALVGRDIAPRARCPRLLLAARRRLRWSLRWRLWGLLSLLPGALAGRLPQPAKEAGGACKPGPGGEARLDFVASSVWVSQTPGLLVSAELMRE